MGKQQRVEGALCVLGMERAIVFSGVDYGLVQATEGVDACYAWVSHAYGSTELRWVQLCLSIGSAGAYKCPPEKLCIVSGDNVHVVPYVALLPLLSENDFDWSVRATSACSETERLRSLFRTESVCVSVEKFVEVASAWEGVVGGGLRFTRSSAVWSRWEWDRLVRPTLSCTPAVSYDVLWLSDVVSASGGGYDAESGVKCLPEGFVYDDGACLFADHGEGHAAWRGLFSFAGVPSSLLAWLDREQGLYSSFQSRESKGAYYTPAVWVSESQRFLGECLGSSWEDEYYVWDCAAGTGNLLHGLRGGARVFASTLDVSDVESMRAASAAGTLAVPVDNIFQFDFLNDSFDKLPSALRDIVMDPARRSRLVVYMNPPYVGGGDLRTCRGGRGVMSDRSVVFKNSFASRLSKRWGSIADLYVQFFLRCYEDLSGCVMGAFSPITYISNLNFARFRSLFRGSFRGGFLVNSRTFDNVSSEFPISFSVWSMSPTGGGVGLGLPYKVYLGSSVSSAVDRYVIESGDAFTDITTGLQGVGKSSWSACRGWLGLKSSVIFQDSMVYVHSSSSTGGFAITDASRFMVAVYFTVRLCHSWPWWCGREVYHWSVDWEVDDSFKVGCLWFMLTSLQNYFDSDALGVDWYPFRVAGAAQTSLVSWFDSGCPHRDCFGLDQVLSGSVDRFMFDEALAVRDAYRALCDYYFKSTGSDDHPVSYYEIRKYFQGCDPVTGVMRVKSEDGGYLQLQAELKRWHAALGDVLFEKVKEYGFLSDSLLEQLSCGNVK